MKLIESSLEEQGLTELTDIQEKLDILISLMSEITSTMPQRWMSLSVACKYTSMSPKTLMRFVKSGKIYATRKGKKWYIDRLSIDAFMKSDGAHIDDIVARIKKKVL